MKKIRLTLLIIFVTTVAFALTGCFDLSMVMTIENNEGDGHAKITITTPSEQAFELIKNQLYKEDLIGPDQPESVQSEVKEESGIYTVEIKRDSFQLGDTVVEIDVNHDRVKYTLIEIIFPADETSSQEENAEMDLASYFEGYSYKFTANMPSKIQKAWWIDSDHEKLSVISTDNYKNNSLSFEAPMDRLMSSNDKGKWGNRFGIVVQTAI